MPCCADILACLLAALLGGSPLDPLRWEARPLLIFAPQADHALLAAQRDALRGTAAGRSDRAVATIEIVGDEVQGATALAPGTTAEALRRAFAVPGTAFAVLLVGKDGGVKLRAHRPVAARTLFEHIDAMPMRRAELRRRGEDPDS